MKSVWSPDDLQEGGVKWRVWGSGKALSPRAALSGIEQTTGSYRMGALWAAWDAAERVAEIGGRCTEGRWGRSCPATL